MSGPSDRRDAAGGERAGVLVLTSTFPRWRGDDQPEFVFELCRRLAGRFDVCVLAPHARGARRVEELDGVRIRRFRYAPARLETVAYGGGMRSRLSGNRWRALILPLFAAAQVLAIARAMRRGDIGVIHAHWIVPQGIAAVVARALARAHVPIVCTSHGGDLFALRGRFWSGVKRAVLARVEAVTVVSAAMAEEVTRLVPARRDVQVAPMGTDLRERFVPAPGVARAESELLFVGRLVPKKGVDFLLRVLARLGGERGRRPRLRIVGSGPEEQALETLAAAEGVRDQVELCGFRPHGELPAFFQRCSVALFPFREEAGGDQEGFGLVVVEALGCACPVIAADLPAVRDVIGDGGHMVALPPEDLEAWTAAIDRLLADPRGSARMGQAGRAWVRERFDWGVSADAYAGILSRAAERHGRGSG